MDCTVSPIGRQALPLPSQTTVVDVAVIGAGPSGALLAYLLAQRGLRVALIEKARLPRVKPCGGGLNQKTVALLPFDLKPLVERTVSRVLFTQKLRRPFARSYPGSLVSMVTRCRFDHFLVQRAAEAGARVYDACQVTRLEVSPRHLTVHASGISWQARYIAFADGAKGTLRRQLGFAATAPHDIGFDMQVDLDASPAWTLDTLYIDWGSWPQSYAWAFPKAAHWSIGVKGPVSQSSRLVTYLRQFMQRWQLRASQGNLRYLAHMLPTRTPDLPLVKGRALVLGDAAGLLEPFTGEGIYYAVRSAHLAAQALVEASAHDTVPLAYATAVEHAIMPELRGARLLQQLFDAYPYWLHTLIRCYPRAWRALAKILRGERGFRDLERVLRCHPQVLRAALWYGQKACLCNSFAARLS